MEIHQCSQALDTYSEVHPLCIAWGSEGHCKREWYMGYGRTTDRGVISIGPGTPGNNRSPLNHEIIFADEGGFRNGEDLERMVDGARV